MRNNFGNTCSQLQDKIVLNVDDNEMNQVIISKLMENAGITTVQAKNGAEAVKKLNDGLKPDVILLDLEMPVMNGLQTSEFIRNKLDLAVPIIINSGFISVYHKIKLKRIGVCEFLEKPYTVKDILAKLLKVCAVS